MSAPSAAICRRRASDPAVETLQHRAIGRRLMCVFADHEPLRLGEGEKVMTTLAVHLGVELVRVDASERILTSRRIVNEVAGVSRVAYHVPAKLPATMEWE